MTSSRNQATTDFRHKIDAWVLERLGIDTRFHNLLSSLPGVYPTAVLDAAKRLVASGQIAEEISAALHMEATLGMRQEQSCSMLPLPHPLDFEWRFAPDSSRFLLSFAGELAPETSPILMFGTPGVALEALSLSTTRPLIFLGENNAVTRRIESLNAVMGKPLNIDICDAGLPSAVAGVTILDPPWYMDFVRPMFAAAALATSLSGYLLVSMPPEGTRPTALDDRQKLLRFASRLGLQRVTEYPLALSYDTPFFESNALAVAGVRVSHAWRRGDLVIFQKLQETPRITPPATLRKERWLEFEIGRMRLLVHRKPRATGWQGLVSVIEGDVLPSVSRRDPRRRRGDVWTSGNRLFASDNTEIVIAAALAVSREQKDSGARPQLWGTVIERDATDQVAEVLLALSARELAEEHANRPTETTDRSAKCTSKSTILKAELMATVSG